MDNSANPSTVAPRGEEGLNLRQYWHTILERRWAIIIIFAIFVLGGGFVAFNSTPVYQAVARLEIEPEIASVLSLRDVITANNKDHEYLQTLYKNLVSRSLIEQVIQKLKLDEDPRYSKAIDRAMAVSHDITIDPVRMTRLVEVKVLHPKPRVAEDIANTLLEMFLSQNQDRKILRALTGYRMLKQEAVSAEAELLAAQESVQRYRQEKKMISLVDDNRAMDNVDAFGLRQARSDVESQAIITDDAVRKAAEGKRWVSEGHDLADYALVASDRSVSEIKVKVLMDEARLEGLKTRYRDKYPLVMQANRELEVDVAKLKAESARAFQGILSAASIEQQKLENTKARFAEAEKRMEELYEAKSKFDVLARQKERAETMYQLILSKTKEFDINSKDTQNNMVIVDRATTPVVPAKPNRPLILAMSAFGGLAVAVGFAFLMSFLDDSVKTQEDVEQYLKLPFLGYVPNIKSSSMIERDLQAHLHPTSGPAEGFRTLRAAISLARNGDKLRTVSVTSTIPSEGKSLVASNYAIVTAQTGLRTLLVDGDLRRPSVHKAFEQPAQIGLSAYLVERVQNVDEIIHSTEVPNLDICCCGAVPSNPSELISSRRMLQFLEEVSNRYDRVVLDCPPVSAVADPLVLGAMSDGMVFVTKFNKIRREHASRSIQRIQEAGIHVVGVVLNDIDFEGKDSYYYSYHYYQNRYYASHYKNKTTGVAKKPAKSGAPVSKGAPETAKTDKSA